MEFFVCTCASTGNVILDSYDQGPNKDGSGNLLPKLCNPGLHIVSLKCAGGAACYPPQVAVIIENTAPIRPREVAFHCV